MPNLFPPLAKSHRGVVKQFLSAKRYTLTPRVISPHPSYHAPDMAARLRILFLCTGNSCRSQMAEGWARRLKGNVLEPFSAGIETHGLNPHAVKVMAEAGVDISAHRSQHVDEFADVPLDYVITVCDHAHEHCPIFPGRTTVVHVGFDDPPRLAAAVDSEDAKLAIYRRVRDQIRTYIESLPDALRQSSADH